MATVTCWVEGVNSFGCLCFRIEHAPQFLYYGFWPLTYFQRTVEFPFAKWRLPENCVCCKGFQKCHTCLCWYPQNLLRVSFLLRVFLLLKGFLYFHFWVWWFYYLFKAYGVLKQNFGAFWWWFGPLTTQITFESCLFFIR